VIFFMIKYLGLDPKTRKEKVSRKALLQRPAREENQAPREAIKITPKSAE
jgi:polyribonucleotide nucleotidyltransferase